MNELHALVQGRRGADGRLEGEAENMTDEWSGMEAGRRPLALPDAAE